MTAPKPPAPPPAALAEGADRAARDSELAQARAQYTYDFSYHGICATGPLPDEERWTAAYVARGAEVSAALAANRAASATAAAVHVRSKSSDPLDGYARMYATIPAPIAREHYQQDWAFAWQRLAGPGPVWIEQLRAGDARVPVTDEQLSAVLGRPCSQRSLLDQRRLYVADYSLFDGVPCGATDGAQKYLLAPVALFVADPALVGGLAPVAIAIGQGIHRQIYTPASKDWALAKFAAQVADVNLQGVLLHMGYCHEVIQRFALATHRQLSARHPLHALFRAHSEFTLNVNRVARESVLAPGGVQDRLLAPTLDAQLSILVERVATIDLDQLDPTIDFARRGVEDPSALTQYPFRDDGLLVWAALARFAEAYVSAYYRSDAEVRADVELQGFVREVGAQDGGRLPAMFAQYRVDSIASLAAMVARVIYRASAYHIAINNGNYDWAGYAPNASTAGFAGLPPYGALDASFLPAMLPDEKIAFEAISATWQVTQLALNKLGEYGPSNVADPAITPAINELERALVAIEQQINERNTRRPLAYTYLLPSRITASINA